jgi:hypothetical protein
LGKHALTALLDLLFAQQQLLLLAQLPQLVLVGGGDAEAALGRSRARGRPPRCRC